MSRAELLAGREVLRAGLTSLRASFTVSPVGGLPLGVCFVLCVGCWGGFCLLALFQVFPSVFVVLHLMHKDVIYPRLSPSS